MLCTINGHYILKGTPYVMYHQWSLYTEGHPICYVPLIVTIYRPHMLCTIKGTLYTEGYPICYVPLMVTIY